ncbi:helix-turn-helix domain-containing protein [Candidatus Woesearchaeota archaeon]|nr:helix-turn-helix domain-containing protein [Candidatus Woesearchaeota archaeon]
MDKIIYVLKNLGFEDKEIKIYLYLIKNPNSTVLQISKNIGIDRTTIYDILERLITKGIVSFIIKNNTKNFNVLKPKELLNYFEDKYKSLENIMPSLEEISKPNTKEKLKCEIFQGLEGLKTALKDLVKAKTDYKIIGIKEEYEKILGYFNEQGTIKLNQSKVKEEAIIEEGVIVKKLKNSIHKKIKKGIISDITIILYNNITIFIIWDEPYSAIRIENKNLYKSELGYFKLLSKL